jgi:hypothetical protein
MSDHSTIFPNFLVFLCMPACLLLQWSSPVCVCSMALLAEPFSLSKSPSERRIVDVQDLGSTPFLVDPQTGAVQTNQSYGQYSDGYFQVTLHILK